MKKKQPLTVNERWEQGIPHTPLSIALYKAIAETDWTHGAEGLDLNCGGDGDNGEHLMYLLDILDDFGVLQEIFDLHRTKGT